LALASNFGSVGRWRDEFAALGKATGAGSGRVTLNYLLDQGTLINQSAGGGQQGVAGAVQILTLDLFEHAYELATGADAAAYVDRFMDHVDWVVVSSSYAKAVHAASEGLGAAPDAIGDAVVIDVRRHGAFAAADTVLPNARWYDPAHIAQWMECLPRDRDILLYCVHGHEVSRACAVRLRVNGFDARYLDGGIDAWQQAGRPLQAKIG
jgi:Fe-Mn family superoxide dismutase